MSLVRLLVILLALAATVVVTVWRLHPPTSYASIDAGYATSILNRVAAEPHPAGSAANDRVRAFLRGELESLGYRVEEQRGTLPHWRFRDQTVPIGNLVATLDGTAGTGRALMLVAHFDSRPGPSRGAGDDAAGVAAVMEAARQLAADRPANDVVVLLTDAEEAGLLGARLWAQRTAPDFMGVAAVVNVEGRGSRGPSVLFETGRGDARLVALYAQTSPHPVASSLGPAVYRLMPNATDFTVFRFQPGDLPEHIERDLPKLAVNLPGLNFAFVGGYEHYHQPGDVPANLSRATLLHGVAQTVGLGRAIANADLSRIRSDTDATFFDVLSLGVVRYGQPWRWAVLAGMGTIGLAGLIAGARRTGRRGWGGWIGGAAWVIGWLVASVAWAQVLGLLLPDPQSGAWFGPIWFAMAAVAALPLVVISTRHRVAAGVLATSLLLTLAVATTALLPGGGYLFTIAAGASGLALLVGHRTIGWWAALVAAMFATTLLAASAWHVGLALKLSLAGVPAGLLALTAMAWLPLLPAASPRSGESGR